MTSTVDQRRRTQAWMTKRRKGEGPPDIEVRIAPAMDTEPPMGVQPSAVPHVDSRDVRVLKVFVSYSRRDLDFTEQLCAALETLGHSVVIDRKGIHGAERWEARLGQMILESDTIVFVLTPASAASEVCRWEVEQATGHHKRIVPTLAAPLSAVQPHEALRDLNYIHFYPEPSVPGSGWGSGLARLHAALSVDVSWIREHTRVAEMAARWQAESQAPDLLARGSELANLQRWREARPANAPDLTVAQRAFLQASEQAETRRLDEERQQIELIRLAQQERERALQASGRAQDERARALRLVLRRTVIGSIAAGVLTLAVGAAAIVAYTKNRQLQQQLLRNDEERHLQDRLLRLARRREFPPKPSIEMLARHYEGESPDHVGTDFAGGVYYGIFRIQAATQIPSFIDFLDRWEADYGARLNAAGGAAAAKQRSRAFVQAWQALAQDPASAPRFVELQSDFVTQSTYERLARQLSARLRLNVAKRSLALQAVIFSIAVQYGPSTTLVQDALGGMGDLSKVDDEALIKRLFEYRDQVEKYFPGIQDRSPNFAALIRERNQWELKDALSLLSQATP